MQFVDSYQIISGGKSSSIFIRLAGISGATAVALGAYGAHKKEWPSTDDLNRDPRAVFEVANKYHFYNRCRFSS